MTGRVVSDIATNLSRDFAYLIVRTYQCFFPQQRHNHKVLDQDWLTDTKSQVTESTTEKFQWKNIKNFNGEIL
jgi:hypothetical protein